MNAPAPHFLLFSESDRHDGSGQWHFTLQSADGAEQLQATDAEPGTRGERLELLAVVRGLEALPAPARVTLVTPSKYVNRGLIYGLEEWRANGWVWERFGELVPVKNRDLWQRVDRALEFHRVECRIARVDSPQASHARPNICPARSPVKEALPAPTSTAGTRTIGPLRIRRPDHLASHATPHDPRPGYVGTVRRARTRPVPLRRKLKRLILMTKRRVAGLAEATKLRAAQLGTRLLPLPWLD